MASAAVFKVEKVPNVYAIGDLLYRSESEAVKVALAGLAAHLTKHHSTDMAAGLTTHADELVALLKRQKELTDEKD